MANCLRRASTEAARRLIALCERYENAATRRRSCPTPSDHLATAQRAAEASAVLLENNGVLPLSPHEDIAVIGSFALRPRYQGAGSSKINPVALDDPWSALCNAGFDARYAQGYDPVTGRRPRSCSRKPARRRAANIAVVIIGLPDRFESEGFDRSDIVMPAGHEALVSAVCDVNPRTVVVIKGIPHLASLDRSARRGKTQRRGPAAVLLAGLAGCRGGAALARLLLGEVNPSGKLAETWPAKLEDTALGDTFPDKSRNVLYRGSIFVGYRWFDAAGIEPAYPFGHGMSYADFRYANIDVEITDAGLRVAFDLENASGVRRAEVAQVYVSDTRSRVFREPQSLAGFAKAKLQPGGSRSASSSTWPPTTFGTGIPAQAHGDSTRRRLRYGSDRPAETSGWKKPSS